MVTEVQKRFKIYYILDYPLEIIATSHFEKCSTIFIKVVDVTRQYYAPFSGRVSNFNQSEEKNSAFSPLIGWKCGTP